MTTVGIVVHRDRSEAALLAKRAIGWLQERDHEVRARVRRLGEKAEAARLEARRELEPDQGQRRDAFVVNRVHRKPRALPDLPDPLGRPDRWGPLDPPVVRSVSASWQSTSTSSLNAFR